MQTPRGPTSTTLLLWSLLPGYDQTLKLWSTETASVSGSFGLGAKRSTARSGPGSRGMEARTMKQIAFSSTTCWKWCIMPAQRQRKRS
ncbi:hypothetical protein BT67DRAFT_166472 [Trichocladium antarcticum]|uniref:Uncharacterized protein n=1 Tax=Trichocladium antarcticum TaxID=1450529 RepID=A0AAN6ZBD3_9PEZI|nr:hypothetical protein BT67DRAFT_166472 [Trichocladium antarcticum]